MALTTLLVGCANPLNRATSDRYADTCSQAEQQRNLTLAEQACYRALVNVDVGNLGPELKSQRLYNLARVKRRVEKYSEAEELLKQALPIQEQLTGVGSVQYGRRLVELSASLAAQGKWAEGSTYLARTTDLTKLFSAPEKAFTKQVLEAYGARPESEIPRDQANKFSAAAVAM